MAIRKHLDQQKNVWVIEPSGYLDLFNLPQVKEDILFCCEELRYLDSAVIKVMAEAAEACRANGHIFRICCLKSYIYKIIEMVGLQKVFVFECGEETV